MKLILQKMLDALERIEQQINQVPPGTKDTGLPVPENKDTGALSEVMDRHEIMAYLQISKRTFYRLRAKGVLPARRIGGRDYFYKKDIKDALDKAQGE